MQVVGATRARPATRGRRSAPGPSSLEGWALGLLVLGGLAVLPGALNRFVLPKLAVTAAGVALAFRAPSRGRLPRAVLLLSGAAGLVAVAAALVGADPVAGLVGAAPRYEGLAVGLLYLGAAVSGARLLGPARSAGVESLLLRFLAVGAVAVAALAVLETFGIRPLVSDVDRPGSLLGNASDQGAWAVLALGPLLAAAVRSRHAHARVGAVAAALAVVLSGSRGALLGAVVVLVVLLVALPGRRVRLWLAGSFVGIVAAAFLVPGVRRRVLGAGLADDTASGRATLWQEALELYTDRPVLGTGPGGFGDAVRSVHEAGWYAALGTENPPDSPHAWPLQALLVGGPLLVLLVGVLGVLVARQAWRGARGDPARSVGAAVGLGAGLAGYAVVLLVHFTGPGHTPLAALFAGALLAGPAERSARATADRVVAVGAWAFVALAASGAVAEIPLRHGVVAVGEGDLAGSDDAFGAAAALRWWDPSVGRVAGHAFAVVGTGTGDPDALQRADRWLVPLAEQRAGADVHLDLGAVREAQGDLPGAAAALDRALRQDPANPDALLLRGVVAARQGDWDGAERHLLAAGRSAPESAAPWANLARVHELAGRPAAARIARDRAEALDG
ncbi:O-antigen ligase [Blastococcus aurantiacus]|uniref:O-antigen ligase n=1 Tax=Blastococcus aurantiacus TaxID=1550231 RepID=A0A1G7P3D1_9ACTN|nr:O-antigen ligase family protein [Blastococcus aurantiacus]SDF80808.1 O-antigen ligase [Blastococcus aurantiacus]